jgi:NAD(P)-dependent dehydrogenase (short-subunit alcohol dehydrogenase family)
MGLAVVLRKFERADLAIAQPWFRDPDTLLYLGEPTWTVAASICGALDALTRALAVELAPIRVNAVAPGVVRGDLWREMSEEDRSAMYDSLSEALPVGRVGEVSDIAETFLYLMRNGYSSGTIVTVDGGSVLV